MSLRYPTWLGNLRNLHSAGWAGFHVDRVRNGRRFCHPRGTGPVTSVPSGYPARSRPGRVASTRRAPSRPRPPPTGPHSTTDASSSSQVVASRRRWIRALRRSRSPMAAILARTGSSGRPSFRRPRLSKISRASSTFPSASPSARPSASALRPCPRPGPWPRPCRRCPGRRTTPRSRGCPRSSS